MAVNSPRKLQQMVAASGDLEANFKSFAETYCHPDKTVMLVGAADSEGRSFMSIGIDFPELPTLEDLLISEFGESDDEDEVKALREKPMKQLTELEKETLVNKDQRNKEKRKRKPALQRWIADQQEARSDERKQVGTKFNDVQVVDSQHCLQEIFGFLGGDHIDKLCAENSDKVKGMKKSVLLEVIAEFLKAIDDRVVNDVIVRMGSALNRDCTCTSSRRTRGGRVKCSKGCYYSFWDTLALSSRSQGVDRTEYDGWFAQYEHDELGDIDAAHREFNVVSRLSHRLQQYDADVERIYQEDPKAKEKAAARKAKGNQGNAESEDESEDDGEDSEVVENGPKPVKMHSKEKLRAYRKALLRSERLLTDTRDKIVGIAPTVSLPTGSVMGDLDEAMQIFKTYQDQIKAKRQFSPYFWFEEFTALDCSQDEKTPQTYIAMSDLIESFSRTVDMYARVIAAERNTPNVYKSIRATTRSNGQCSTSYGPNAIRETYSCAGIEFRLESDSFNLGIFGTLEDNAGKFAHNTLRNMDMIHLAQRPGGPQARTLPMVIAHYMGCTVTAMPQTPFTAESMLVGTMNGGQVVKSSKDNLSKNVIEGLSKSLSIAIHRAGNKKRAHDVLLGDVAFHKYKVRTGGAQNFELYPLDIARLCPPEAPWRAKRTLKRRIRHAIRKEIRRAERDEFEKTKREEKERISQVREEKRRVLIEKKKIEVKEALAVEKKRKAEEAAAEAERKRLEEEARQKEEEEEARKKEEAAARLKAFEEEEGLDGDEDDDKYTAVNAKEEKDGIDEEVKTEEANASPIEEQRAEIGEPADKGSDAESGDEDDEDKLPDNILEEIEEELDADPDCVYRGEEPIYESSDSEFGDYGDYMPFSSKVEKLLSDGASMGVRQAPVNSVNLLSKQENLDLFKTFASGYKEDKHANNTGDSDPTFINTLRPEFFLGYKATKEDRIHQLADTISEVPPPYELRPKRPATPPPEETFGEDDEEDIWGGEESEGQSVSEAEDEAATMPGPGEASSPEETSGAHTSRTRAKSSGSALEPDPFVEPESDLDDPVDPLDEVVESPEQFKGWCPDTWSKFDQTHLNERAEYGARIRKATDHLISKTIPQFVEWLLSLPDQSYLMSTAAITDRMHECGINVRHLGFVTLRMREMYRQVKNANAVYEVYQEMIETVKSGDHLKRLNAKEEDDDVMEETGDGKQENMEQLPEKPDRAVASKSSKQSKDTEEVEPPADIDMAELTGPEFVKVQTTARIDLNVIEDWIRTCVTEMAARVLKRNLRHGFLRVNEANGGMPNLNPFQGLVKEYIRITFQRKGKTKPGREMWKLVETHMQHKFRFTVRHMLVVDEYDSDEELEEPEIGSDSEDSSIENEERLKMVLMEHERPNETILEEDDPRNLMHYIDWNLLFIRFTDMIGFELPLGVSRRLRRTRAPLFADDQLLNELNYFSFSPYMKYPAAYWIGKASLIYLNIVCQPARAPSIETYETLQDATFHLQKIQRIVRNRNILAMLACTELRLATEMAALSRDLKDEYKALDDANTEEQKKLKDAAAIAAARQREEVQRHLANMKRARLERIAAIEMKKKKKNVEKEAEVVKEKLAKRSSLLIISSWAEDNIKQKEGDAQLGPQRSLLAQKIRDAGKKQGKRKIVAKDKFATQKLMERIHQWGVEGQNLAMRRRSDALCQEANRLFESGYGDKVYKHAADAWKEYGESLLRYGVARSVILGRYDGVAMTRSFNVLTDVVSSFHNPKEADQIEREISKAWDDACQQSAVYNKQATHTFEGHSADISALAYGDYTPYLYSGSHDKNIYIWDVYDTMSLSGVLEGHEHWVSALIVKNNTLISASGDKTIRYWDCDTRQCTHVEKDAHSDLITDLAVDPSTMSLFSSSEDRTIRRWDFNEVPPRPEEILTGHTDAVSSLVVVGDFLFSAGWDCEIRCWNLQTLACSNVFSGHLNMITCLAATSARLYSGGEDNIIIVWDLSAGPENMEPMHIIEGHTDAITGIVGAGDRYVFSSSGDTSIRQWDVQNGFECVSVLEGHEDWCSALCSDENGTLYSGSESGDIKRFDNGTMEMSYMIGEGFVGQSHRDVVTCLGDLISTVEGGTEVHYLVSGAKDFTARIWDISELAKPTWKATAPLDYEAHAICTLKRNKVTPTGVQERFLFAVGSEFGQIDLYEWHGPEYATEKLFVLKGHKAAVNQIVTCRDPSRSSGGLEDVLFSCSEDKSVRLWNMTSGQCISILRGHRGPVKSLSMDGRTGQLYTGGGGMSEMSDNDVRLWKFNKDSKQLFDLTEEMIGNNSMITHLTHTRHGVVSVNARGLVKLWDRHPDSGKWRAKDLEGHKGMVSSLTLSSRGASVYTCGDDGLIRRWNVQTVECSRVFPGPALKPATVLLSTGSYLITAYDCTIEAISVTSRHWRRGLKKVEV